MMNGATKFDVAGRSASARPAPARPLRRPRRGCSVIAVDRKRERRKAGAVRGIRARDDRRRDPAGLRTRFASRFSAMMTFIEGGAPDVEREFSRPHARSRRVRRGARCGRRTGGRRIAGSAMAVRSITRDGRIELVRRPIADGDSHRRRRRPALGRSDARIGQVNRRLIETRQITVPLLRRHEATDIFLSAGHSRRLRLAVSQGRSRATSAPASTPAHKAQLKDIVAGLHAALVKDGRVSTEILGRTGGAIPAGGMLKPLGSAGRHARAACGRRRRADQSGDGRWHRRLPCTPAGSQARRQRHGSPGTVGPARTMKTSCAAYSRPRWTGPSGAGRSMLRAAATARRQTGLPGAAAGSLIQSIGPDARTHEDKGIELHELLPP